MARTSKRPISSTFIKGRFFFPSIITTEKQTPNLVSPPCALFYRGTNFVLWVYVDSPFPACLIHNKIKPLGDSSGGRRLTAQVSSSAVPLASTPWGPLHPLQVICCAGERSGVEDLIFSQLAARHDHLGLLPIKFSCWTEAVTRGRRKRRL